MKTKAKKSPEICPDCGVKPGEPHLDGCEIARCTVCGIKRYHCACTEEELKEHDPIFARWSGYWPGMLEAQALGIDYPTFEAEGFHKIFFIKPKLNV